MKALDLTRPVLINFGQGKRRRRRKILCQLLLPQDESIVIVLVVQFVVQLQYRIDRLRVPNEMPQAISE